MITLNEREYAEDAIRDNKLGAKPVDTLLRVARYYLAEGYKKTEIRPMLDDFLLTCDASVNLVKWTGSLDWVMKNIDKYKLIEIEYVPITQKEIDVCASLKGHQAQRVLFSLICTAKFGNMINEKNSDWVNRPDKEVFRAANVSLPIHKQSILLHDFMESGFIKFSKKVDNTNINVCCIDKDENAKIVLKVSDFRNLGYQFERHMGGKYFECVECGIVVPKKSNAQKYCKNCGPDMNRKKTAARYSPIK